MTRFLLGLALGIFLGVNLDPLLRVVAERGGGMSEPLLATGFDVLAMDPHYSGSCPCATVDIDGTRLEMHCWRVCLTCEFVGLHYSGDRAVAERVKPLLDAMDWYGEWPIVEGLRHD